LHFLPFVVSNYKIAILFKVGGVGGCAEFYFFHEILFIYNYLGLKNLGPPDHEIKTKVKTELIFLYADMHVIQLNKLAQL
jgi:hypothetical protein